MGFFKKLFNDVGDAIKNNVEERKQEIRQNIEERKQEIRQNIEERKQQFYESIEERKKEALSKLGVKSEETDQKSASIYDVVTTSDDNNRKRDGGIAKETAKNTSRFDDDDDDDDEPKIIPGEFKDGVLTIREGITELDDESLECYKRIRKIVFPASLEKLESYVIDDQERLEELDFSKVSKLKEIPDDFISGNSKIRQFIIPNGVTEVGDGFLGEAESGTEVYVPASVKKLGYITGNNDNDMIVYLFAANIDIEEVEVDIKTLYVLPQYYAQYAKKLKACDSEARLREMPDEKMNVYGDLKDETLIKLNSRTETDAEAKTEPVSGLGQEVEPANESEIETVSEKDPEVVDADNSGVFSARLEAIITAALQDGVLTDKEREILKRRVEKEGEDWEEVEMIVEARLAEMQPTATVTQVSQTQVQPVVMSSVQESPYLVVNGKEYKDALIDEIDEDILTNVTGLDASDIISVTIPSSVKGIKKNAFFSFRKLKELVIPNSVESIEEDAFGIILSDMSYEKLQINCPIIPENAFNGAPLKEVIFGEGVKKIESTAFANCEELESITLPHSIIEIGGFGWCGGAFQCCKSLKKVDLSQCENLKSIGSYTFGDCTSLSEIDFSSCVSLRDFGGDALSGCPIRILDFSKCKSLDLPWLTKEDLEKVIMPPGQKSFNEIFLWEQSGITVDVSYCNELKQINSECFKEMDIKEIVIPDTVETIGENAFDECENLKTIVMPAALKEIKAPLGSRLEQLKKVDFSEVTQLRTIPKKLFDYGCDKLKELMIPNGVTEIEDDALLELRSLKKLFLPPSLTTMGDFDRYSDSPSYKMNVYCYSPRLEALEPLVYGWDDDEDEEGLSDEDIRELGLESGKNNKIKTTLYVLPQYVDAYTAQRDAECIPNDVLTVLPIPDEYLYYYDN